MTDERYAPAAMPSGAVQRRLPASLAGARHRSGCSSGARRCRSSAIASRRSRSPSPCSGLGSATDLGLVLAAGGIPFALFALAGGVWADRVGRRRVMLASDIVRALSQTATAALLLTGTAEVWMLAVLAFVYGTAAAVFMPALMGLIPQTVSPARLQEANGLLALTRSIASVAGPALAGVLVVAAGSGEAIAVDAATFAVSALCLARMRLGAEPAAADAGARARATSRSSPGCAAGWHEVRSRTWLTWGLIAMSVYHVFVLPVGLRARPGARRRASSTAPRAGRPSSPASGSAASWATWWRCASRCAGRSSSPRWRWWAPARRRRSSAAGWAPSGSPALELLAGICVALFFTLWDLSIQEQIPAHAVSRVSAYDFSVSHGPHAAGHGDVPARSPMPLGLQATLLGMSAIGLAGALAWLAQPSVRRLRRPQCGPPAPDGPSPARRGRARSPPPTSAPAGATSTS